jgi:cytochrome c-type biogenesis protein CcmH/NrfG
MIYVSFCLLLLVAMLFLLHRNVKRRHFYISVLFLGLTSFGLYSYLGSPRIPDWPYVESDQEKELKKIIDHLEKKLKNDPKDMISWRAIGDAYKSFNHISQAMTAYDNCGEVFKDDPDFLINHAECLIENEKGEIQKDAMTKIETALKWKPNHPLGLYYKALFLEQNGQKEESLKVQEMLKGILNIESN